MNNTPPGLIPDSQNKERLVSFDLAKGILILSVIYEHIIIHGYIRVSDWSDIILVRMSTSFNMVAFFLISGYMLRFSSVKFSSFTGLSNHCKKRLFQCFLPILSWSVIKLYLDYANCGLILVDIVDFIFCKNLWFLRCLFLCDIILSILIYFFHVNNQLKYGVVMLGLIIEGALVIFGKKIDFLANVYYYLPFMFGGYMMNSVKGNQIIQNTKWIGIFFLFYFLLLMCYEFQGTSVLVRYPLALCGSLALFGLCKYIIDDKKIINVCSSYFVLLGKYTLPIYCIHSFIIGNKNILFFSWDLINLIVVGALALFISAFCLSISKILSFTPILDVLFNGNYRRYFG